MISVLIIGIDGWMKYTEPLITSLRFWNPGADTVVIDNASDQPYPKAVEKTIRTERLCYSAAINEAYRHSDKRADWVVVLSNDVHVTDDIEERLREAPEHAIVGPQLKVIEGYYYLEGWCVCVPQAAWRALGGWDENYRVSSWEDVDYSTMALQAGYNLVEMDLPVRHLDQKQRFTLIPGYWDSEAHNVRYFMEKHAV